MGWFNWESEEEREIKERLYPIIMEAFNDPEVEEILKKLERRCRRKVRVFEFYDTNSSPLWGLPKVRELRPWEEKLPPEAWEDFIDEQYPEDKDMTLILLRQDGGPSGALLLDWKACSRDLPVFPRERAVEILGAEVE